MTTSRLVLTREQILAYRRRVGALDERLPAGPDSLRRAAWAGLQDSMPRAALFSIHARVEDTQPSTWTDPSLVQLWGPRFSMYVVPAVDRAIFSLGRMPDDAKGQRVAEDAATKLHAILAEGRIGHRDLGETLGINPSWLRHAAPTGTVLMRWEGARQPTLWAVRRPDVDPREARLELARRHLHVFGPTTPAAFATWAGIGAAQGEDAFEVLAAELTPASTPIGDAWVLTHDEPILRAASMPSAAARLLPSGDAYYLLQGADRELLVPDAQRRGTLWTTRVWPGAVLVRGEVAGTWRRAGAKLTIEPWGSLPAAERDAVQAEAESLPLPGLQGRIRVSWAS